MRFAGTTKRAFLLGSLAAAGACASDGLEDSSTGSGDKSGTGGATVVPAGGAGPLTSPTSCDAGRTECGEDCVDLSGSATNCGECDQACESGQSCDDGLCVEGGTGGTNDGSGGVDGSGGTNDGSGGIDGSGGTNEGSGGMDGSGGSSPSLDDVNCWEDIQACIDARESGSVILGPGTYTLKTSLIPKSNVNLLGQGPETIITWHDSVAETANRPMIEINNGKYGDLDNVRMEDFQILCTVDAFDTDDFRKRQRGIFFDSDDDPENDNTNITLKRLEISNCGGEGIKGGSFDGLLMEDLNLHDNGRGETDWWHNIYLSGGTDVTVRQTTLSSGGLTNSPNGHGIRLSGLSDVYLENLRVVGNADHGIHMNNVENVRGVNLEVTGNCADPNGGCKQVGCYGDCDYDFTFAGE